jgi:hypothetical protein
MPEVGVELLGQPKVKDLDVACNTERKEACVSQVQF